MALSDAEVVTQRFCSKCNQSKSAELFSGTNKTCKDCAKRNRRYRVCHNCNVGLGHFKNDIALVKNVIKYLEMAGE